MKTFLAALICLVLSAPVQAGLFCPWCANKTVVYNYGAPVAGVYYSAPAPTVYYSAPAPSPDSTAVYTEPAVSSYSVQTYAVPFYSVGVDDTIVTVRHREKHHGNRHKIRHKEISR